MNLLQEKWLQARSRTQGRVRIAPAGVTDPDIINLAMPRADFQGAAYQWLLGLLQTACPPDNPADWLDWYEQPPSENTLAEAFAPFVSAFELDGDGPRFMQDLDPLEEARIAPVSGLLIDAPGANGIKNNTDFFVKRGQAQQLCADCAALALYTIQANGPAGGAGFRTGLRGGGPLTTLILPDEANSSLWHKLWLNVVPMDRLTQKGQTCTAARADDSRIFPWLAPTPTSEAKGSEQYPEQWHPLHPYWSMPRRFRLLFEDQAASCDVCGRESDKVVCQVRAKNYGINYAGPWRHPLTPYRYDPKKPDTPPWSKKGRPGDIDYRHWSAFVFQDHDRVGAEPAVVVKDFTQNKYDFYRDEAEDGHTSTHPSKQVRLWVFGFDLDNMKARGWKDTQMPLLPVPAERLDVFREWVGEFLDIVQATAREVSDRIRHAWFKDPKKVPGDTSHLTGAFFAATQAEFFDTLRRLRDVIDNEEAVNHPPSDVAQDWYAALRSAAYRLFDEQTLSGAADMRQMERSVRQRRWLAIWLAGGGKKSRKRNPVATFAAKGGFDLHERETQDEEERAHA